MASTLVVDSSILVGALVDGQSDHAVCQQFFRSLTPEITLVAPLVVMVEVVGAVRRRTGSEHLAQVTYNVLNRSAISFVAVTKLRARRASHVAIQRELRGMDAVVVAAAQEFRAILVTLDSEMIERAKTLVPIAKPQDFV